MVVLQIMNDEIIAWEQNNSSFQRRISSCCFTFIAVRTTYYVFHLIPIFYSAVALPPLQRGPGDYRRPPVRKRNVSLNLYWNLQSESTRSIQNALAVILCINWHFGLWTMLHMVDQSNNSTYKEGQTIHKAHFVQMLYNSSLPTSGGYASQYQMMQIIPANYHTWISPLHLISV